MFLILILLVELSTGLASATEFTYSIADGNVFMGTSPRNYALTGTKLAHQNIKSVSVNGDSVFIVTPSCQFSYFSLQALDGATRAIFENLRNDGSLSLPPTMFGQSTQASDGRRKYFKVNYSRMNPNRASFTFGQHMRSMSSQDFPEVLNRVVFEADTVTYVYYDGTVAMKPIACVETSYERQFLDKYKSSYGSKQTRDHESQLRERANQDWNQQQANNMPMQNTILQQQSGGSGMYQATIHRGDGKYGIRFVDQDN